MLENLPEDLQQAWLYGSWDVFAGQYFTEWSESIHVIAPFDIPSHWRRYVSLDYGLDMLAAYCIAIDERGRAYVYRETYESGLIISDAAQAIKRMTGSDTIYQYFAPPDMWNKRQETGKSVAEIFGEHGIYLTKAQNDRVAGWLDMHEWLKVYSDEQDISTAGLRVMRGCTNLIRCIPLLQFDDKRPSDVATEPHKITHAPDAIRYFCAGRPFAAPQRITKKNSLPFALQTDAGYTGGVIEW